MAAGNARSGFDIDLLDGKAREDAFARVLVGARFEHKRDYLTEETGNVAIEYKQKGPPTFEERDSGIAVTRSEWWVVEFAADRRLVLPTAHVKALAREAVRQKRTKWCGDDNNYLNALVPFEWFRQRRCDTCGMDTALDQYGDSWRCSGCQWKRANPEPAAPP